MNNITDERVVATRQRWHARGFLLLYFALNLDIIVRVLVLKQPPRQWMDIGLIWMATTLYVSLGMSRSGVDLYSKAKPKSNLMVLIILGLEIPALLWLMGSVHSWMQFALYGLLAAGSAYAMQIVLRLLHKRWEQKTLGQGTPEE